MTVRRGRALVDGWPGETRAAVLAPAPDGDEALVELLVLRADKPSYAGNLYLGRVSALDRGLNAAFVELGLARSGLLPLKTAPAGLQEGAAVSVRVVREPSAGKGAKLAHAPDGGESHVKPPALLAEATPLLDLLRRVDPERILVEGAERRRALADTAPDLQTRIEGYTGTKPLFEEAGLNAEIEALLEPEVPLAGGGQLLIEPVRTLTAIDVDAGRADARGGRTRQALEVNLDAVREIARQCRLRALSGLIVVDFLELETKSERQQVANALQAAFADDSVAVSISPMRASGLVEIARQRARPPLHELLSEPVGRAGRIADTLSLAYDLLRRAWAEALANPGRTPVLKAHPDVLAELDGRADAAHAALTRALGRRPERCGDPTRPRTVLDILLA
ncbi:ribonuclease E/G [Rhodovibrio salinarum]|uniref:Ribonuclease E/G n=1 Tax=Rhodovibrio salinarum TaxID=1087 RepID=A0A934QGA6_9PROT|nr:ribonuclease E/G [Rhodovibrio salinarum]MBK1696107.1 ribonuclease E/G [Rhodovibrio salinarum]